MSELLPVREFKMSHDGYLVLRDYREDGDLHNVPYYKLYDLNVGGDLTDRWLREWHVVAEGSEPIQHYEYEAEAYCSQRPHLAFNATDLGAGKPGWRDEYRDVDAAEQDRERRIWVQAAAQAETQQREADRVAAHELRHEQRKAYEAYVVVSKGGWPNPQQRALLEKYPNASELGYALRE